MLLYNKFKERNEISCASNDLFLPDNESRLSGADMHNGAVIQRELKSFWRIRDRDMAQLFPPTVFSHQAGGDVGMYFLCLFVCLFFRLFTD